MSEIDIIKHDVLKLINKVEELEQMIINLTYKRKEEEKNELQATRKNGFNGKCC